MVSQGADSEEGYPNGGFPIDVYPVSIYLVGTYPQGHTKSVDK